MMRLNRRNNLDEFQEQKLLKIESKAFWIALWGLCAVFAIQYILGIGKADFLKNIAGELIILLVLIIYLEIACMKQGIWSRKLQPNAKTNFIISLITGLITSVLVFSGFHLQFHKLQVSIIVGIISGIITFILCIAALSISTSIYKKRLKKLENIDEDNS